MKVHWFKSYAVLAMLGVCTSVVGAYATAGLLSFGSTQTVVSLTNFGDRSAFEKPVNVYTPQDEKERATTQTYYYYYSSSSSEQMRENQKEQPPIVSDEKERAGSSSSESSVDREKQLPSSVAPSEEKKVQEDVSRSTSSQSTVRSSQESIALPSSAPVKVQSSTASAKSESSPPVMVVPVSQNTNLDAMHNAAVIQEQLKQEELMRQKAAEQMSEDQKKFEDMMRLQEEQRRLEQVKKEQALGIQSSAATTIQPVVPELPKQAVEPQLPQQAVQPRIQESTGAVLEQMQKTEPAETVNSASQTVMQEKEKVTLGCYTQDGNWTEDRTLCDRNQVSHVVEKKEAVVVPTVIEPIQEQVIRKKLEEKFVGKRDKEALMTILTDMQKKLSFVQEKSSLTEPETQFVRDALNWINGQIAYLQAQEVTKDHLEASATITKMIATEMGKIRQHEAQPEKKPDINHILDRTWKLLQNTYDSIQVLFREQIYIDPAIITQFQSANTLLVDIQDRCTKDTNTCKEVGTVISMIESMLGELKKTVDASGNTALETELEQIFAQ
ncbi:hypothetical protein COU76_03730 [Candidatus Peregrinibacteria bacterium CG10_big_fil_rev_8_21_14_0_10_49_10]|nr:MAG: hypothetical protein COU76_03730 [Candidatus Peregrinibacteria bacterium CG10_big_fil_rev_8_21_14_0_10_49_10]